MTDPYGVLGVGSDATDAEIAKAYKRLAKRYHPDLNPDNAAAAARMGQINQAYDEIKRLRQSGNRRASGAQRTREPHYAYRPASAADWSDEYAYHRPPSTFRVAVVVLLTVLLLQLFSALLGETVPVQRFKQRFAAQSSGEMYPYPVFTHLYP